MNNDNQNPRRMITSWGHPNEQLDSQYGRVTYRQWCELEKQRAWNNGRKVWTIIEEAGMIALSRVPQ